MCGFSVAETYMGNNLSGYTPFMDRFGAARLKVKRADEQDEKGNLSRGETYPIRGDGPFFIDFLPGIKVKDKGKITVDVVFDDFDLLKGLPVLSDLKDFSKVAAYVVEVLERL